MKNLFYSTILVCIGLISLFILQSCQRPDGSDDKPCVSTTENYYLSDAEKNTLPYTGFDTIRMVSNLGDTIQCIGTGKQFFKTYEFVPYSKPSCGNTGTEKYYEAYKIIHSDFVRNINVVIILYKKHSVLNVERDSDFEISFKSQSNYFYANQISDPKAQIYVGDINVNGKTYNNVSKSRFSSYSIYDTTSFALVNKQNGIIQIQLNPNEIWTILN